MTRNSKARGMYYYYARDDVVGLDVDLEFRVMLLFRRSEFGFWKCMVEYTSVYNLNEVLLFVQYFGANSARVRWSLLRPIVLDDIGRLLRNCIDCARDMA